MLQPKKIIGPLYTDTQFKDTKDPCIVFDGKTWHIYGSGGNVKTEKWFILHAVAESIEGPWKEIEPAELIGVSGDHVAAPSVVFEDGYFHMFVQTEFFSLGGSIKYLKSKDGHRFEFQKTILESIPGSLEAGVYDVHEISWNGKKYIVYAATPAVMGSNNNIIEAEASEGGANQYIVQPDVYLAESEKGWDGPWQRLGKILDHDHIDWHHNPRHHHEYEWGIEGPQIIALPNGLFLLNATCFLFEGKFGTRQRVFFAISDQIRGPYTSLGPVITPNNEWESGENGHASAIIYETSLYLFYQARSQKEPYTNDNNWRYGISIYSLGDIYNHYEKSKNI